MFSFRLASAIVIGSLSIVSCQSSSTGETTSSATPALPIETQLTGKQLSQAYCSRCHQYPEPALLDKETWKRGVLPQMALRMGQAGNSMVEYMRVSDTEELTRLMEAKIFPETPTLHPSDWQKVVDYYVTTAPATLPKQPAHPSVRVQLPLFAIQQSSQAIDAFVTLLRYDSLSHRIWAGDGRSNLYALNHQLHRVDSLRLTSPLTDITINPDGSADLLSVGVLNPNDRQAGAWNRWSMKSNAAPIPVLTKLQRPVNATSADLNRDGRNDVVVCQFGHHLGKLTWHEKLASGTYTEHLLDSLPGARAVIIKDVNKDQWPDIIALLTQGDEQIAVYYNQRNGQFRKDVLLRFPPVYGSSYIDMVDIDQDGDDDLVYANGDNADYSIVLKPYHGLRIFRNDGKFRFKESWFYPMYGATQTLIRDFDQDGDLDIAAIAHFPDFNHQPNESFIFFENKGNLRFQPQTFPNAERGRWLRMEAGDVDEDGDEDIVLGAFFRPVDTSHVDLMKQWQKPGTGVVLLRNTLKKANVAIK